ncbi:MAG: class F sortase [Microbacteriaceae bacterium]|uniref:class F sortase n=1 Tax=Microbacterium sp. TaxID=51671 RepID=UPI003F96CEFE
MTQATAGRRRRVPLVWLIFTTILVLGGIGLIGGGIWQTMAATPPAHPVPERVVTASMAEQATPVPAGEPHTVRIPVIQFEADVDSLSLEGSTVINPPTFDRAYWLSEYGMPGSDADGTVYLSGHSSAAGTAVFDPLIDRADTRSALEIGDEILVDTENGTVVYLIQALERHPKTELADIENLWTPSPGRLVIVTCYYDGTAGTAPDNFVVYARLAPESGA